MTTLSPSSALFLANVNRVQQRIAQANAEVTSGKKINVAADSPDQIDTLLQLRANLQRNTQIQSNLTLANTDAAGADDALAVGGDTDGSGRLTGGARRHLHCERGYASQPGARSRGTAGANGVLQPDAGAGTVCLQRRSGR